MKNYRAVIFDWDGTLMDSTGSIAGALQAACREMELPVPTLRDANWVIGLSLESALYRVAPTLDASRMPAFLDAYRRHFLSRDPHIGFFSGVPELLGELKQKSILLGVATGKSRVGLDRALDGHRMHDHFDCTRCADESGGKPQPGMLLHIMDRLGLQPDEVLMVGDTSHDVLMAHNAGVDALAVTYGAHDLAALEQAAPVAMAHSVPEMREWLAGRVAAG